MTEKSFDELAPGERGRLARRDVGPPAATRLLELGFVDGTEVEVVRRGPLGDPVELALRGYRICVRRADLQGFRVVVADEPA